MSPGSDGAKMVPTSCGAAERRGEASRVEALGQHLLHVWLEELGDPHLGVDATPEALEPEHDAEEQREVGREHQLVVAQQLHAAVHDRGHVEMTDADEQVAVQPRLDRRPEARSCRPTAAGWSSRR